MRAVWARAMNELRAHLPVALDVVRLCEAAEASIERGGANVQLGEFEPVTEGAQ